MKNGRSRVCGYGVLFLAALVCCRATTARPGFLPLPAATSAELELGIPDATRAVAEQLARDSLALATIKEADGFIDSGWLDAATLEHSRRRPLGSDVVRVRAWVNPARDFWSEVLIEATYRPLTDPSRPQRELDVVLPADHPLQRRLAGSIRKLIETYGDAEALKALAVPQPVARPDTTKLDSTAVKKDTTSVKPDTIPRRL